MLRHVQAMLAGFAAGERGVTPGDFPLADLDDGGLAKLATVLKAGGR